MQKNKYFSPLAILFQLIGVVLILHFSGRMAWGFDLIAADEGFYLDAASRLFWGDKPFLDEVYTTTRGFEVVLSWVIALSSSNELLTIRWISFGLQAMILILFTLSCIKISNKSLLVFLLTPLLLYTPYNLWTLSYVNVSCLLVILFFSLFYLGNLYEKTVYGKILIIIAALLSTYLFIIYTPFFVLPLVFCVPLILTYWQTKSVQTIYLYNKSVILFLSIWCLGIFLLLLTLKLQNNLEFFLENIKLISANTIYKKNRLINFLNKIILSPMRLYWIIGFLVGILVIVITQIKRYKQYHIHIMLLLGFILLLGVCYDTIKYQYGTKTGIMMSLAALFTIIVGHLITSLYNSIIKINLILLVLLSFGSMLLMGLASANALHGNILNIYWIILGVILVCTLDYIQTLNIPQRHAQNGASFLLCIIFTIYSLVNTYSYVYMTDKPSDMTTKHTIPHLKNIISKEEYVQILEPLANHINTICKPGDYLLIYSNNTHKLFGLNYLTNTRPALRTSIVGGIESPEFSTMLISTMKNKNITPTYAVTKFDSLSPNKVIDKYILDNYKVINSFKKYDLLQLK